MTRHFNIWFLICPKKPNLSNLFELMLAKISLLSYRLQEPHLALNVPGAEIQSPRPTWIHDSVEWVHLILHLAITVTSYERLRDSNHRYIDCLFKVTKTIIPGIFREESISDRWIPLTKDQWCGNRFQVMMSSWHHEEIWNVLCPPMKKSSTDGALFVKSVSDVSYVEDDFDCWHETQLDRCRIKPYYKYDYE